MIHGQEIRTRLLALKWRLPEVHSAINGIDHADLKDVILDDVRAAFNTALGMSASEFVRIPEFSSAMALRWFTLGVEIGRAIEAAKTERI